MNCIINIPQEAYDLIMGKTDTVNLDLYSTLIQSVKNGTPLPKGHGKLVDLNEVHILLDNYMYNIDGLHDYLNEELETVVEADKEDNK